MDAVVFVPGIMGSTMTDSRGRMVWPPGELDDPLPTDELVKSLLSPDTAAGAPIEKVRCDGPVYGPVLAHLAARDGEFIPFGYDWRLDLRVIAGHLAARIAAIPGTMPIVLVAHSMGGLVVRWMLECGAYEAEPWFARLRLAVFAATPHRGAPLALFRILGLDGIPIIVPPWAFAVLSGNTAQFPSGYQLLPAPQIDCVHRSAATSVDVYEGFPGLDAAGVSAVRALHETLDRFARPGHIRYVIANGAHIPQTVVGATLAAPQPTEVPGEGDGTVPVWSSDPTWDDHRAAAAFSDIMTITADHVGLVSNKRFLDRLDVWLGQTS